VRFDVEHLDVFALAASIVVLVAIFSVRLTSRLALPSLLLFLLMGVVIGENGLGVHFDDANVAHALGFAALAVIIAEGGITADWSKLRRSMRVAGWLATIGVIVSVFVMAALCHWVLGFSWELSILLGAITSPTDAAAVFSVLRTVRLPRRVRTTLEAESGLNDAPTAVLVTLISEGRLHHHDPWAIALIIVGELVLGIVCGLLIGRLGAWLLRRVALPSVALYPLAMLAMITLAYAVAAVLHGSGFAAVYVAALIMGNSGLPHRNDAADFAASLAWVAQIGLFVMLGLLLSPSTLTWTVVGEALVAGLLLTFVARPVSVLSSFVVKRMNMRDLTFLSWAGLRGAVPIVLATIPFAAGVDDAEHLFNVVFVMVVIYTIVTGPTLPWLARRLDLITPPPELGGTPGG
jgi:cell volume regulation protein A